MTIASQMAEQLARLPAKQREKILKSMTNEQVLTLQYDWKGVWARPSQLEPPGLGNDNKTIWLLRGGRGSGKTRAGAEWIRGQVEQNHARRVGLIAPTAGDVRDVMVEGESGIIAISHPQFRPKYEPSKRRLTWPNGALGTLYSADEPDRLNGPQHDRLWADEVGVWKYPLAWDYAMLGLRLGVKPLACATTTAKRSHLYRSLLKESGCITTFAGSTYDNIINLPQSFLNYILGKYEGTTLGRQEIHSELIDDVEGALWKHADIDKSRCMGEDVKKLPDYVRVVVALDPSVTSTEESDECGVVVAAVGTDGDGYVLDDLSGRMSPAAWGALALKAYDDRAADLIVGEANNGGDMVENTIRTVRDKKDNPIGRTARYKKVHASRGKITRAEPIAALYEQGRVHHVGEFPQMEDEMCTYVPGVKSPNRMDALVWAFTELMELGGIGGASMDDEDETEEQKTDVQVIESDDPFKASRRRSW